MKTYSWVKQNPNTVKFDEEKEAEEATSLNIVNKKRAATVDAGSERKKHLTAVAGSQPQPHGKIRIYSIHNVGMCLQY